MTEVHSRVLDGHGFVGLDAPQNVVYIVFTGTDPLAVQNYFDDLDFIPVEFPGCEGCWVHRGFYHTYLGLRDQVLDTLAVFSHDHPSAKLHITGHSLGGAMAVFAALELIHSLGLRVQTLYTFGQPRVGNAAFQTFLHEALSLSSCAHFRITQHRDPIVHLPPTFVPSRSMGFQHEPQEVFYPCGVLRGNITKMSGTESNKTFNPWNSSVSDPESCQYIVCDPVEGEDPRGSDRFRVDLNFVDHVTYLGFPFTANYMLCDLFQMKDKENSRHMRSRGDQEVQTEELLRSTQ